MKHILQACVERLETAYSRAPSMSPAHIRRNLAVGDLPNTKKRLKYVPTKDPRVKVGYEKRKTLLEFWIFVDDRCEGRISFQFDLTTDLPTVDGAARKLRSLFPGSVIAVPHVTMAPGLRGLGYPTFVYGMALNTGMILVTEQHTQSAARLWESLGKKFHLFYFNPKSGTLEDRLPREGFKVLSKKPKPGTSRPKP